ncbi:hypothetical protein ACJVC5_08580 [Peredibacter sp. HCB2-198]|uniref:hypothetical protein n=1 Tax=Peredibacter sp. HCB2-198 TaxID=3383025 RepID=UPI0038B5B185
MISLLIASACQPVDMVKNFGGNIVVNIKGNKPVVTKVKIENDQLIITGSNLQEVNLAKIEGDTNHTFTIESKSSNQLILNAKSALTLLAHKSMSLIVSNAYGAATFPISFELQDGQVTSPKLHHMGASTGQFLQFNGTTWVPGSISTSQVFAGGYDAASDTPDISSLGGATGTYYIVTVAGSQNLGSGIISLDVGDWVIFNGTTWERLAVGTNTVSRFNNRTGLVVPMTGDYTWDMLTKTAGKLTGSTVSEIEDVDIAGIQDGDILQWNQTNSKWEVIPLPTLSLSAGSVTNTHIANGSIDSTKISDGSIVNADISAAAAIDQSKINGLAASFTAKQDFIATGANNQYWRGDKSWQTLNTAAVTESTNLYFTEPRVLGTDLAGYSAAPGVITAADTVLTAIQKLSGNLGSAITSQGNYVLKGGDTLSGPLAMGNNRISGLADPTADDHAANKLYVDTKFNGVSSSQWITSGSDIYYTTGKIGIGTSTPLTAVHAVGTGGIFRGDFYNDTNSGADFMGRKARGTVATPAAVQTGDRLTGLYGAGYNDAGWASTNSVAIQLYAAEPYTTTAQGSFITFDTTTIGTTARAQRMRIDSNGNVGIGTSTPTEKLEVAGNIALTGKARMKSNTANYVELQAPAGLSTTLTFNLPASYGNNNEVLTTDGAGNLSWATMAGGGAGSIGSSEIADGSITNADISATAAIDQTKINGLAASFTAKQDFINAGTNLQYWRGDKSWQTLNTTVVPEGTNEYFTPAKVLSTLMSGYATGSALTVNVTDTVSQAIGKLEGQIAANKTAFDSSGVWSKNGTDLYYNGGYVGVGTSTPQSRLDIDGSIRTSRATDNSTSRNISLQVATDTNNAGNGFANGDSVLVLDGGANTGSNTLHLFGIGARTLNLDILDGNLLVDEGKVGIGTTNPIFPLEIKMVGSSFQTRLHSVGQMSGMMMRSENSAAAIPNRSWSIINANEYGNVNRTGLEIVQYTDDDNDDTLCEPGEVCRTELAINKEGKVGIGTNAPTAKLHITGTAGTDGIRFPDNTLQTSSASGPIFSATNATTSPTTSNRKVLFETENFDTDNSWDTTTSRLQPTKAGYYQINVALNLSQVGNGGSTIGVQLHKNGTIVHAINHLINYTASFTQALQIHTIVYFNGTTDYAEVFYGTNNTTNNATIGVAAGHISGNWLRP